jgi:hypothetical protein
MSIRSLVLAVLGSLALSAAPALAAGTVKERFEKKVARYAEPLAALDFAKPRGLCTCSADGPSALAGQAGILAYEFESGIGGVTVPVVGCEVPIFDAAGAAVAMQACVSWSLLRR